jgi:hypothetical protein
MLPPLRRGVALPGCRRVAALIVLLAAPAEAQDLSPGPITFAEGRISIGIEAAVGISTNRDDQGWFNYTDYEHNALRRVRFAVTAALTPNEHFAVLTELRSENAGAITPYALYARVRPWKNRSFDIQAGRIPPVFGAFGRRTYLTDNPLIGYPLAYQYLTSVRTDAIPRDADELLGMRSRGWQTRYSLGSPAALPGLPLASAFQWDTGVEVRVGSSPIEFSVALTNGTLARPQVGDDNSGKQIAARVAFRPVVGMTAGASVARGAYLAKTLDPVLAPGATAGDHSQQAWGGDFEYSRGYWLVRAEGLISHWDMPTIAESPLVARAFMVEGRYKILPGLYAAGRADRLTFSRVIGARRGSVTWDAPVSRIEVGGGYSILRNLLLKLTYQYNWRDGGRLRELGIGAGQLQLWF